MSKPRYLDIHTLRSECKKCNLDTKRDFVLKDNENPTGAFEQMQAWVVKRWPKDHGCTHRIKFTWITDKEFHYSVKKQEPVKK
jgi:hypothetical protein